MSSESCSTCSGRLFVNGDCVTCTPLASAGSITLVPRPSAEAQAVRSGLGGVAVADLSPGMIGRDESL